MASLLISVRTAVEAAAAVAGGAAIIDIKEPARGSLGRADDDVIADIVRIVGGRRPVSAAQGELLEERPPFAGTGLSFVKYGLAGCGRVPDWRRRLRSMQARTASQLVFVAYADWQCAQAPPIADVVAAACERPGNILLVDTHCKDPATLEKDHRPTLLDWFSVEEATALCQRCEDAGVKVALAGSLGLAELKQLRRARPAWFAVRGAVCDDGSRQGSISEGKIRALSVGMQS